MSVDFDWLPTALVDTVTKNFFNFDGRTSRMGFWHYFLAVVLLSIVTGIILSFFGGLGEKLHSLIGLVLLLPGLGIGARRLHDIGKSGWLQLIAIIPILGIVVLIYLWAQPGESGPNAHGAVPPAKDV